VELGEQQAAFARAGLNVASISYDSVEVLKGFAERKGLRYPLLADPDSTIIRAFGILNETVPKGTPFYGVPYPGTYVLDARGVVKSKFFENDYKERYTAANILERTSPAAARGGWREVETRHLTLRYRASDAAVRGGSRATLELEVKLKPKMHVYAPGVQASYIPVRWDLEAGPFKSEEVRWPVARTLRLEAIKETVPVYEGSLAARRDLTFSQQKELLAAGADLKIKGSFRYQACDDKECYIPVTLPLEWTFRAEAHDGQRAPAELRRK
jgi:hypothetical protein